MKKYFSKWLQTYSGSLKAVRVVLKRLPHSLRSFAMTDFYLSGSLKVFLILFIVFSANSAFADEISSTASYLPGGQYRMFGGGRGDVEKVKNKIKKIHTTSNFGPLRTDTDNYSGSVYYEQRFYNHPIEEHGPFSNSNSIRVIDVHGSIRNGYVGYTNVKISGSEVHPDDAYDGGDHPYDAYTYHVDGTVKTTSIQPIELPKLPNPFDKNKENADKGNQNNEQPENNPTDANDRTRDLTATGNPSLPNTEADGNNGFNNNGEVPLPQASGWKDILDGGLGFATGLLGGAADTLSDAFDAVTHPADTVRNIGGAAATVATNPSVVSEAVVDAYDQKRAAIENAQNSFERGVEVGKIPGSVVAIPAVAGAVGKATSVAKGVAGAGKVAGKADDVAKNAPVTSNGTANAATYPKLKEDLRQQNLANIAKQDLRLAKAAQGSGSSNPNFNIGSGTRAEADQLGRTWVGDGAKRDSGYGWISADGTRGYRPPTTKDNTPSQYNPTGTQANFETYEYKRIQDKNGNWSKNPVRVRTGNGYMVITD